MIKPICLEELNGVPPIAGPDAARTIAQLTDPAKRRLVWFLQWASHQDGGLKKLAHALLTEDGRRLGSRTMHSVGFDAHTVFHGVEFEAICDELNYFPQDSLQNLQQRLDAGGFGVSLFDIIEPEGAADRVRQEQRRIEWEKEKRALEEKLDPRNRRLPAATFLYKCRERAVKELPALLVRICKDASATWSAPYFQDLTDALQSALARQACRAAEIAADTKIATFVESALSFAHRTKTLVIVKGTERLGKTEAAKKWTFANPDKARLISLTADTSDALFYGEIFDALGCGDKGDGTVGVLRRAIRDTVQTTDLTLVFDEAHCLFGLSQKVSIKRLEYIRTEFANRGIPVALIITPQFAARLSELEQKTSFNVNQFRGRIARWAELPSKPSRSDIECLCRFYLPDAPKSFHELLTNFGLESEYPFAAVKRAIIEARELLAAGKGDELNEDFIKNAIGFALFTGDKIATTLPLQAPVARRKKRQAVIPPAVPAPTPVATPPAAPARVETGIAPIAHEACTPDAARGQRAGIAAPAADFSNPATRTQEALTY